MTNFQTGRLDGVEFPFANIGHTSAPFENSREMCWRQLQQLNCSILHLMRFWFTLLMYDSISDFKLDVNSAGIRVSEMH